MKILFVISTMSYGTGGHLHSLNHISREIGKSHEVKIVTVGYGFSPVLASNPHFHSHFLFNGLNILKLYQFIKVITKQFHPDCYHFFDYHAYDVFRLFLSSCSNKVILTKCGGPNIAWPFVNNFVLFHNENLNWYKSIPKYRESKITLIPNRILKIKIDPSYQPVKKEKSYFNFIRICRIGIVYKQSILNTIYFIKHLNQNGFKVKLFVVGTIENQQIYQEIVNKIGADNNIIQIITDKEITSEASCMLYLADAVIGTGRSLMEASSLGIPVLTFNSQDSFPLLVDLSNFETLFSTNFSERNRLTSFDSKENMLKIEKMITNKDFYKELSNFSLDFFTRYFDVTKVSETYTSLYMNAKLGPNKYFGDARLIFSSFKSYFNSFKSIRNQVKPNIL